MTLAGTINYLYIKYKKPLAILVLIFFTYNIFNYCLKKYEGFSSNLHPRSRCSTYKNCAECVKSSNNCFWGDRDQKCSSIQLNGYGNHVFHNVPVIVTSFTVDLRNSVDYISTNQSSGTFTDSRGNVSSSRQIDNSAITDDLSNTVSNPDKNRTWAPTDSQFQVQLQPIYSRESVKKFSMQEFVNGSLSNRDGIGFI